jgi:hypothetical protein
MEADVRMSVKDIHRSKKLGNPAGAGFPSGILFAD